MKCKWYVEYRTTDGFQSEVFDDEAAAQRFACTLSSLAQVFIGPLCPKCGRSTHDQRRCKHVFHELTVNQIREG